MGNNIKKSARLVSFLKPTKRIVVFSLFIVIVSLSIFIFDAKWHQRFINLQDGTQYLITNGRRAVPLLSAVCGRIAKVV